MPDTLITPDIGVGTGTDTTVEPDFPFICVMENDNVSEFREAILVIQVATGMSKFDAEAKAHMIHTLGSDTIAAGSEEEMNKCLAVLTAWNFRGRVEESA